MDDGFMNGTLVDGWTDGQISGWLDRRVDECIYVLTVGWVDEWRDGGTDGLMNKQTCGCGGGWTMGRRAGG